VLCPQKRRADQKQGQVNRCKIS